MRIFKTTAGKGENVVVIHGAYANHEDMLPIAEKLASRYTVTSVDCPGMGHSDWDPSIHSIHDLADKILAVLPEHATYIGWSFGGLLCQSIAARYPERVKRFIGIGTTPKFIAASDWIGFPQPGYASLMVPALESSDLRTVLTAYYEHEFSRIDKAHSALYPKIQEICKHRPNSSIEAVKKITFICDTSDLRKEFQSIQCPIDLIIGEEDANVPPSAWPQIKTLNAKVQIHPIKDAEHAPFWTHPQAFWQIMDQFI